MFDKGDFIRFPVFVLMSTLVLSMVTEFLIDLEKGLVMRK